jgi:hypothetical protein
MDRPAPAAMRPRHIPGASYEFAHLGPGDDEVPASLGVKDHPAVPAGKPDYLKRMWYLAIAMCCFFVILCTFAGVAMGYIVANQGIEAMASVRDMRTDTRQLHDAVMQGKKMAEDSAGTLNLAEMIGDAKGAIHQVAEILRQNPEVVQQTLAQVNQLATHVQALSAKFTPDQFDAIKQDIIAIAQSTKQMLTSMTPDQISLSMARFQDMAGNATSVMARLQADNVISQMVALAATGASLGQRILDTEQIVVNIPKYANKR